VRRRVILDTGPLVALLDGHDGHHRWAVEQWSDIGPPLISCEAVISEACFLLDQTREGSTGVFEMVKRRAVVMGLHLDEHVDEIDRLRRKYADVPMSVADACLVRLAEQLGQCAVLTLDRDFSVYRRHGRQVIPLITPPRI
jgi:predicted nucleic acid-binding protein